jgi:hypothetical protein
VCSVLGGVQVLGPAHALLRDGLGLLDHRALSLLERSKRGDDVSSTLLERAA